MSRWKNYGLYISIASLIGLILKQIYPNFIPEQFNTVVTTILSILVTLGVISDPTTGRGYLSYPEDKS